MKSTGDGVLAVLIESLGDDIAGIAIHIDARVMITAGRGQDLVSHTISDLVAGSGLQFDDRSVHTLGGIPSRGNSSSPYREATDLPIRRHG